MMDQAYSQMSDTALVQCWRDGHEGAATEIHKRYIARLLRVIELRMGRRLNARVAAEDVVQSAFRTLFARVRRGEFEFSDDEQFWKLLVTIALNKWRNVQRHHFSGKRSPDREDGLAENPSSDALAASRLGRRATVAESVIFADLIETILGELPEDERQFLLMRLEGGYSQKEIAQRLNLSDRTIRRMPQRIHDRVTALALDGRLELDGI